MFFPSLSYTHTHTDTVIFTFIQIARMRTYLAFPGEDKGGVCASVVEDDSYIINSTTSTTHYNKQEDKKKIVQVCHVLQPQSSRHSGLTCSASPHWPAQHSTHTLLSTTLTVASYRHPRHINGRGDEKSSSGILTNPLIPWWKFPILNEITSF